VLEHAHKECVLAIFEPSLTLGIVLHRVELGNVWVAHVLDHLPTEQQR
jgi:hypothetical protein